MAIIYPGFISVFFIRCRIFLFIFRVYFLLFSSILSDFRNSLRFFFRFSVNFCCCIVCNFLQLTKKKKTKEKMKFLLTWTRDSGNLILHATSSRMKISGYRVFPNNSSSTSSCARENVVRSLRCFLGFTPVK